MSAKTTITWVDAEQQLPDSDTTVLIHCPISDDPVWLGYHDGETWRAVDGEDLDKTYVDHWADLPVAPNTECSHAGDSAVRIK